LQGASILAPNKVPEDSSRNVFISATTAVGKDVFKNYLKKQAQQLDGSSQQTTTNNGQGESKSAKMDRSALLRAPASNSSSANSVQPDQPMGDTDRLVLGSSSEKALSVDPGQDTANQMTDETGKTMDQETAQPQEPALDSSILPTETSLPVIPVLSVLANGTMPMQPAEDQLSDFGISVQSLDPGQVPANNQMTNGTGKTMDQGDTQLQEPALDFLNLQEKASPSSAQVAESMVNETVPRQSAGDQLPDSAVSSKDGPIAQAKTNQVNLAAMPEAALQDSTAEAQMDGLPLPQRSEKHVQDETTVLSGQATSDPEIGEIPLVQAMVVSDQKRSVDSQTRTAAENATTSDGEESPTALDKTALIAKGLAEPRVPNIVTVPVPMSNQPESENHEPMVKSLLDPIAAREDVTVLNQSTEPGSKAKLVSGQDKPEKAMAASSLLRTMTASDEKQLEDSQDKAVADTPLPSNGEEAPAALNEAVLTGTASALNQPVAEKVDLTAQSLKSGATAQVIETQVLVPILNGSAKSEAKEGIASGKGLSQDEETDGKTLTVSKTDISSLKTSAEVIKALAGKLEESDGKDRTSADKKDSTGVSELKKLMAFESGRLQAVRLTRDAHETNSANATENQEAAALTQTVELKTAGDINKTLGSDLSAKNPVDVKNLIDQLVQKAELTVKANSSEMKIQLEPESLGKITIKIALEDGLLTARFTTDNHQVKHILENNLSSLRQSLEAQGIKVEKTEVNVQLDSGGTFGGYQEGRQEMWQRPETPNYQSNSNAADGYELIGEEDLMESAFSQTEYYGIQADGSMNFVV